MNRLKVFFFLRRIGPYHHARFSALANLVDLTTIETRSQSQEYPWKFQTDHLYKQIQFPTSVNPESGLHGKELRAVMVKVFSSPMPDVVITTGWADQEYHAAVLIATKHKIPVVVISDSRVEDEPRVFYKEWIKQWILKSYSSAITAGSMSTNYLMRLGFNQRGIFKPWDVVDNNHFSRAAAERAFEEREFICVSRFIPKKNLALLIDVFSQYRRSGGKRGLVLLGSGEGKIALQSQVKNYGLEDIIKFKGFVQYDELPTMLSQSFSLILPSTTDQWGLVVNEAMASGLPVIVSEQCGCAIDLVEHAGNGFVFNAFDGTALLNFIKALDAKNEASWHVMGALSRRIVSAWSLDDFAEATEKACRYAVENPSFGSFTIGHRLLSQ